MLGLLLTRMKTEKLDEFELTELLNQQREQTVLIRKQSVEIKQLQDKTTIVMHFQVRTTGRRVILSAGHLQHPSFLPKAVCWVSLGLDIYNCWLY